MKAHVSRTLRSVQRSILAGIITIGPLFVTYLIFSFLLESWQRRDCPRCICLPSFSQDWFAIRGFSRDGDSAHAGGALHRGPSDFAGDRAPGIRPV